MKQGQPPDEPDAVKRIQRALVVLGFKLPNSFTQGPNSPDGKFGQETFNAVQAFQKREFPQSFSEWDGRAGKNTLTRMDLLLPKAVPISPPYIAPPRVVVTTSACKVAGDPVGVQTGGTPGPQISPTVRRVVVPRG